jgi:cobalt-precorrin 5A hydrolase
MDGSQAMSGRIIAGIGCRRNCPSEEIAQVVRRAEDSAARPVTGLATPAFKAREPGLLDAARQLDMPVISVAPEALAAVQDRCVTRSDHALAATGFASIAEASALAAAGPGGRLILPRIVWRGATCALAQTPP